MRERPPVTPSLRSYDPSKAEPPSPDSLFRTLNTNFGAYLISVDRLRFKGAELAPNGTVVELVFFDPENVGPDLQRRFSVGAVELVNARVLFETRAYLLQEIKRTQFAAGVGDVNR